MYEIRPANERGVTKTNKITSHHSFTFNRYYNQNYLAWSDLRVLNEDFVAPKGGFPTHAHQNQLILTIILEGTVEHKDSEGNISQLKKGEMQLMSAGIGVEHSEYNPSETEELHFLQIWIAPQTLNEKPSYIHYPASLDSKKDEFIPLFSPAGQEGENIDQDIIISKGCFTSGNSIDLPNKQRYYWLQIISGEVLCAEHILKAGDGLHYFEEDLRIDIQSDECEVLLFDMQIPK